MKEEQKTEGGKEMEGEGMKIKRGILCDVMHML